MSGMPFCALHTLKLICNNRFDEYMNINVAISPWHTIATANQNGHTALVASLITTDRPLWVVISWLDAVVTNINVLNPMENQWCGTLRRKNGKMSCLLEANRTLLAMGYSTTYTDTWTQFTTQSDTNVPYIMIRCWLYCLVTANQNT